MMLARIILTIPAVILPFFFILLSLFSAPASADLQRCYQSDDVDEVGTVNSTDLNEIARYTDILFFDIPSAISEQNEQFVNSFPDTSVHESIIPEGASAGSSGVIKDAYIKLIPVSGFVRTLNGKYLTDDVVRVGYIVDYRIELPPDKTERYPKHYYSLQNSEVRVRINSWEGYSKKDIIELTPADDRIRATAIFEAVVKETVKDEVRVNNSTRIVTYSYTHSYSLTRQDTLPIEHEQGVAVYELRDESGTIEYWVLPNSYSMAIQSGENKIVSGLNSVLTYRAVKTVTKCSESGCISSTLYEPAYDALIVPSYELLSSAVLIARDSADVNLGLSKNFKVGRLFEIKALRIGFTEDIQVVDVFGRELDQDKQVKYYLKPVANVEVDKTEGGYEVRLLFYANKTPYNGPVYLTVGANTATINVTNGSVSFDVSKRYTRIGYSTASTLPDRWHESNETVFFDSVSGSFIVGKPDSLTVSAYRLIYIGIGALPFICVYFLLRWILKPEEEEYL